MAAPEPEESLKTQDIQECPVAQKEVSLLKSEFGRVWEDEYHWMKNRKDSRVIPYLVSSGAET